MWWSNILRDKKKENERARIQMELALSSHENPYENIIQDMRNTEELRRIKRAQQESRRILIQSAVSAAERSGLISNEELAKYYLDETGLYMPKLKSDDK